MPKGSEIRLGVDRDEDGYFDDTEIDIGTDPADADSVGDNQPPVVPSHVPEVHIHAGLPFQFHIDASDPDVPAQGLTYRLVGDAPTALTIDPAAGILAWTPRDDQAMRGFLVLVEAVDDGTPPLASRVAIPVTVRGKFEMLPLTFNVFGEAIVRWHGAPGRSYQVEVLDRGNATPWLPLSGRLPGFSATATSYRDRTQPIPPERYYRVRLLDE